MAARAARRPDPLRQATVRTLSAFGRRSSAAGCARSWTSSGQRRFARRRCGPRPPCRGASGAHVPAGGLLLRCGLAPAQQRAPLRLERRGRTSRQLDAFLVSGPPASTGRGELQHHRPATDIHRDRDGSSSVLLSTSEPTGSKRAPARSGRRAPPPRGRAGTGPCGLDAVPTLTGAPQHERVGAVGGAQQQLADVAAGARDLEGEPARRGHRRGVAVDRAQQVAHGEEGRLAREVRAQQAEAVLPASGMPGSAWRHRCEGSASWKK